MGIFGIKTKKEKFLEEEKRRLEEEKRINEKTKKDTEEVVVVLDKLDSQIKVLFKRCQIEDDQKIILDIRLVTDELRDLDSDKLLTQEVKTRFEKTRELVKAMLSHNLNLYGMIGSREKSKKIFEEVDTIDYPQTSADVEKLVKELEDKKDKDSSLTYIHTSHFVTALVNNFVEENKCTDLLNIVRRSLQYNLNMFGSFTERANEENISL